MTKLWISTPKATGQVNSDGGIVKFAPPIWRKFTGKPLQRLVGWLKYTQGPVTWEKL